MTGSPDPIPADSTPAGVDAEAIRRIGERDGGKLLLQMLGIWLEATPPRLARLRAATEGADPRSAEREFHSIRSSALQIGFEGVAELAGEGERMAASAAGDSLPDIALEVATVCGRIRPWAEGLVLETSPSAGASPAGTSGDGPTTRLAVVEDNEDNRVLVRALLAGRYDLDEYRTGGEALTGLEANPPDLVLLDVSLPGMDGLELLGRIRRLAPFAGIPVIALTAFALEGARERLLGEGFDDYIPKPILDEADLIDPIERLLRSRDR